MKMRKHRRHRIGLMHREFGNRHPSYIGLWPDRPNLAMADRWAKLHVPRLLGRLIRRRLQRRRV